MLQAMAGHDPADPASADRPVPDYRAALSGEVNGLRIGLIRHFYEADNPANEVTQQGIAAAVRGARGSRLLCPRASPFAARRWAACGVTIMLAEGYAIHEQNLRERFTDYGEIFRDRMALAALITGADYIAALRRRRELAAEFVTAMADLDLVMTAVVPSEAPPIDAVGKFAIFDRPLLTIPSTSLAARRCRCAAAIRRRGCRSPSKSSANPSTKQRFSSWHTPTKMQHHGGRYGRSCPNPA